MASLINDARLIKRLLRPRYYKTVLLEHKITGLVSSYLFVLYLFPSQLNISALMQAMMSAMLIQLAMREALLDKALPIMPESLANKCSAITCKGNITALTT